MIDKSFTDLYDILYGRYIPNALEMCKRDGKAFDDLMMLDSFRVTFDKFWRDYQSKFIRHRAFGLLLENSVDFNQSVDLGERQKTEDLLKMFSAAEIELRITSEMTQEQKLRLATILHSAGCKFLSKKQWPSHAGHCLSRAADLFDQLKNHREMDDCLYYESTANLRRKGGLDWFWGIILYLAAGFGYRPYRLLGAGVSTVMVFAFLFWHIEPTWIFWDCLLFSGMNYLAMIGYGDIEKASALTKILIWIQGFISLVLNSTFVALLARKWFRY